AASGALQANPAWQARVARALASLIDRGATQSPALTALLACLEAPGPSALVVDLIEQDLDRSTQQALIAWLRTRAATDARPLFLMTRSSAIL
ncbi:MerR family transcriptional regulator, partial [Burkholderia sp. SIMBA_043]